MFNYTEIREFAKTHGFSRDTVSKSQAYDPIGFRERALRRKTRREFIWYFIFAISFSISIILFKPIFPSYDCTAGLTAQITDQFPTYPFPKGTFYELFLK